MKWVITCRNLQSLSIQAVVKCEKSQTAPSMDIKSTTITVQTTVWSPSDSGLYQWPAADACGKSKNQSKSAIVPNTGLSLLVSSSWVNPLSVGTKLLGFCWTTSSFSLTQSAGASFKKGWGGCLAEAIPAHEMFQPSWRTLLQMVEGPADCAGNTYQPPGVPPAPS